LPKQQWTSFWSQRIFGVNLALFEKEIGVCLTSMLFFFLWKDFQDNSILNILSTFMFFFLLWKDFQNNSIFNILLTPKGLNVLGVARLDLGSVT
jgi:hypothetical protein